MIPTKIAFVDIETTGGRFKYDRIIEIGIVLVEDDQLQQTFSTLINPNTYLPQEITSLTGISHDDLRQAPRFSEIADDILKRLEGYTLVAHNVRFDYGFLKAEFKRLNIQFTAKHFCTVRLSRALYPTYKTHNLDSIITRFSLYCKNRHRALDDALVIHNFYHLSKGQIDKAVFEKAMRLVLKKPYLPVQLPEETVTSLPEGPGVYIFYAEDRTPLYIGKSITIKERVLSHFSEDLRSPLEMKISQQIRDIKTIPTAGELGALFLESHLIKTMLPLYNRMLRRKKELVALRQIEDTEGYLRCELQTFTNSISELPEVLGIFASKKKARDFLSKINKEYRLCEKLLGLEKTSGSCFSFRLERCKGACVGKEQTLQYNLRFITAFTTTKIKRWPYNGPIIIQEQNPNSNTIDYFLIDQWCFLETVTTDSLGSYKETEYSYNFDLDTYKILVRYLSNPKNEKKIKPACQFRALRSNHTF